MICNIGISQVDNKWRVNQQVNQGENVAEWEFEECLSYAPEKFVFSWAGFGELQG